jgi:hypothetical protein
MSGHVDHLQCVIPYCEDHATLHYTQSEHPRLITSIESSSTTWFQNDVNRGVSKD